MREREREGGGGKRREREREREDREMGESRGKKNVMLGGFGLIFVITFTSLYVLKK